MNLGLIGFGHFGQFAAKHLRQRLNLVVWDARDLRKRAAAVGVRWGSREEAAAQEFVLLAVPVSALRACLEQIAPHLNPGALLMDCCSVKVRPVEWMLEAAPEDVEVLGTHALFGPQSGRAGVAGLKVVLCPVRTRRLDLVRRFLEEMGLVVEVAGPEEHDRAMAATQALAQFVGRGLIQAGIQDGPLKTPTFDRLLRLAEMLRTDAPELFRDMHRLNPFAAAERRKLLEALIRLHNQLESSSEDV
jgi:prephenate dehydrogenase